MAVIFIHTHHFYLIIISLDITLNNLDEILKKYKFPTNFKEKPIVLYQLDCIIMCIFFQIYFSFYCFHLQILKPHKIHKHTFIEYFFQLERIHVGIPPFFPDWFILQDIHKFFTIFISLIVLYIIKDFMHFYNMILDFLIIVYEFIV